MALIGDKTVDEGSQLTFTAVANDTNVPAQTLTFSLDPGAPDGAAINPSSGLFTWTPTEEQGPAVYYVTVRVTDDADPGHPPIVPAHPAGAPALRRGRRPGR